MKKIFGFYVSRTLPEAPVPTPAFGIYCSEWAAIRAAVIAERAEAKSRQKNPDGAPSQYMRGLDFAIKAIEAVAPHVMEVQ